MTMDVRSETLDGVSEVTELFLKCRDEFTEAERCIKLGELDFFRTDTGTSSVECRGLFFPAINELRYAGKHICDFYVSRKIEDLREAISHCVRAKNDAYDCLIQYRLCEIRLFMEQYKSLVLGRTIKNFSELQQQVYGVIERSVSRPNTEGVCVENLDELVAQRAKDYEILKGVCEILRYHRDKLNEELTELNVERDKKYDRLVKLLTELKCLLGS